MYIRDLFYVYLNKCEFHFSRLHVNKINSFCFLLNNGHVPLRSKTGIFLKKNAYESDQMSLKFRGASVYYSNEKQLLCACFCLTAGFKSSTIGVPK